MTTYITPNRISYFTTLLHDQHWSENTIASYITSVQKLEIFLDGAELSKDKMTEYKHWLEEQGLKPGTIKTYICNTNVFLDAMGWKDMKIKADIIIADDEEQKPKQISVENYKKLVYTALQNDKERIAMILQVICLMGLRFCELGNLTMEALENGYVEVVRKRKPKIIEIPDVLIEDLRTYAEHEQIISGPIFCTSTGQPIDRSTFRRNMKNICALAGIDEEEGSVQYIKNVVIGSYPYYGLKKWE